MQIYDLFFISIGFKILYRENNISFYRACKLGKNTPLRLEHKDWHKDRQTTLQNQFCTAPKIPVSYGFMYCEIWPSTMLNRYWTKFKGQI